MKVKARTRGIENYSEAQEERHAVKEDLSRHGVVVVHETGTAARSA